MNERIKPVVMKMLVLNRHFYGENWDVVTSEGSIYNDNLDKIIESLNFENNELTFNFIFKYDSIKVENNENKSIIIYDVFVRIKIEFFNGKLNISNPSIARTTFTPEQHISGYIWSHVKQTDVTYNGKFNTTCFGEGQLKTIITKVNTVDTNFNIYDANDNIIMSKFSKIYASLILSIEPHIAYESLEGGPHIRMAHVNNKNKKDDINKITIKNFNYVYKLLESIPKELIKVIYDGINYSIDMSLIENWLLPRLSSGYKVTRDDNRYYFVRNMTDYKLLNVESILKFKNEIIPLKLINVKTKNNNERINPNIMDLLKLILMSNLSTIINK